MTTYYVRSNGSNTSPYDTWAKAAIALATVLALATNADTIYVSGSLPHSETQATAQTETCATSQGLKIIAVNDGAAPPTAVLSGGILTNTGNVAIVFDGHVYVYGLNLISGSASAGSTCAVRLGNGAVTHGIFFDTGKLECRSTGASAPAIVLGPPNGSANKDTVIDVKNTSLRFGATGQSVTLQNGRVRLTNISLDSAGSIPTTLFKGTAGCVIDCEVVDSDLSARAFTNLVNVAAACSGKIVFRRCKLPASINVTTGTFPGPGGLVVEMWNCDSGNTNYRFAIWSYEGSIVDEHTVVKTGGASDGVTANSLKMVSSASARFWNPLYSPWMAQKLTATGSALTDSLSILHDSVTDLTDAEVWLEVEYFDSSTTPHGAIGKDRSADILTAGAAQASDAGSTWTTTGLTNPRNQKLDVAFTPQQKGYVRWRVALAKVSYTVYADNAPTIA